METLRPPIIGIPMYPVRNDDTDSATEMAGGRPYADRLRECGALPVFLPLGDEASAREYVRSMDGILLPGGGDVDPVLFGEEPHPNLGVVQRERDDFEIALCRGALEAGKPLLGICRGFQVLNVAMGGTLIQDIPSEAPSVIDHRSPERTEIRHTVVFEPGSLLAGCLGAGAHGVNSLHHQGVRVLAPGLTACGICPDDGLVEAVQATDCRFVVGVQFHPEWLPGQFGTLFQAFVDACTGARQARQDNPNPKASA